MGWCVLHYRRWLIPPLQQRFVVLYAARLRQTFEDVAQQRIGLLPPLTRAEFGLMIKSVVYNLKRGMSSLLEMA